MSDIPSNPLKKQLLREKMLDIISQQGSLNKDIIKKREVFLTKEIKNANVVEARSISYLE